jgi:hypothetical protein
VADECADVAKAAAAMLTMFDDEAWEAPIGQGVVGSIGFGVEALWFDTFIHGDDMRSPLGLAPDLAPGAVAAAVSHVTVFLAELGWTEPFPSDDGAAYDAVLVATGRAKGDAPPNIYA